MKTIIIAMMLLLSTETRAEEILLTERSQAEVMAVLLIFCPTCFVANLKNAPVKKVEDLKKPEEDMSKSVERSLASETEKISK